MCPSVSPGCFIDAEAASLVPLGCLHSAGRSAHGRLQAVEDEAGDVRGGGTDQTTTVQQRGLQTFPTALTSGIPPVLDSVGVGQLFF